MQYFFIIGFSRIPSNQMKRNDLPLSQYLFGLFRRPASFSVILHVRHFDIVSYAVLRCTPSNGAVSSYTCSYHCSRMQPLLVHIK